jgi:alkanesulfonate monooxygenase SsuD/methylene tetrahydromethanopterin reductase-like flavin-dependent oxidoreductase (luciferase family)
MGPTVTCPTLRYNPAVVAEAFATLGQLYPGLIEQVNGRLYDAPEKPIPLLLAANGPKAMKLAGEHGDGLITDPKTCSRDIGISRTLFRSSGGPIRNYPYRRFTPTGR